MQTPCRRCGTPPTQPLTYCEHCGYTPGIPILAALTLLILAPATVALGVTSICVCLFSFEYGLPSFVFAIFAGFLTKGLYRACQALTHACARYPLNREQKQILRTYLGFMVALTWFTLSDNRAASYVMTQLALQDASLNPNLYAFALFAIAATFLAVQLSKVAGRKRG